MLLDCTSYILYSIYFYKKIGIQMDRFLNYLYKFWAFWNSVFFLFTSSTNAEKNMHWFQRTKISIKSCKCQLGIITLSIFDHIRTESKKPCKIKTKIVKKAERDKILQLTITHLKHFLPLLHQKKSGNLWYQWSYETYNYIYDAFSKLSWASGP